MQHRACRFPAPHARDEEALVEHPLRERAPERRTDPILATLVDVAIACRENLRDRVAQAFLHETGMPEALARRVLDGSALTRATLPTAVAGSCLHEQDAEPF
jgi:hypothetical protein